MKILQSASIAVIFLSLLTPLSGVAAEAVEPYGDKTVIVDNQIQKYAFSEIPIEWIYPDFYDAVEPNTDTATSGICGEALSWQLEEDGTLSITGTGAMTDFARVRSPWYANRSKITAVSFPAGITYIGNYAFYDCDNLTTVEIPDTVTAIGMGSFSDCDTLAEMVLGKNLCTIGNSAFYFSDALAAITMPDNLQTIGTYAFGDSIKDVRIPASVTYIPEEILSLSNICAFTSKNETQIGYYTDEHNILFYGREDGTAQLVKCPRNYVDNYIVSDNVTEICAYAFANRGLHEISFPDGLSSIGDYAFDSNALTHVTLNPSLTAVGIHAFWNNSLDTLTIPDSLTTIGEEAFQPKRIVIPDSVTYVAPYFAQSTRTEAYIVSDTDGVGYFDEDCVLYYADPDTDKISLVAFPPAREIPDYSILPGTKTIEKDAFYNNAVLTALHIPASVEEIKTSAPWCSNLQSIYFTGDAPTIHGFPVDVILYYNIGADGWTAPYWTDADNNRHKTAVLMPDFNGDGTFDYYDITKLYSCFRGKTTLPKDTYTDFDGDGTFGYYDITRLYGIYRDGGVAGNGDNGFNIDPYVTASDEISFRASVSGTVRWYFSKYSTAPTSTEFMKEWNASSSSRSGKVTASGYNYGSFTFDSSYTSTYPYIVVMLTGNDNTDYQPVVVDVMNNSNTGFTITPYCDTNAEKVYFKTASDGVISYYFSRSSSSSGLTEDFDAMYDYTSSSYKGSFNVKGGSIDYIDFSAVDTRIYGYIVIQFTDKNDIDYMPVAVDLTKNSFSDSSYNLTIYSVSKGKIRFAVDTTGTLHYEQVASSGSSPSSFFSSSMSVTKDRIYDISYDENGDRYMAMWIDNLPVTYIDLYDDYSRDDDPGDGSNTRGSGFRSTSSSLSPSGILTVTFIPEVDGTVTFTSNMSGGTGASKSVSAGTEYTETFDISKYLDFGGTAEIGDVYIYMQLTSGDKVYERVTVLDSGRR